MRTLYAGLRGGDLHTMLRGYATSARRPKLYVVQTNDALK